MLSEELVLSTVLSAVLVVDEELSAELSLEDELDEELSVELSLDDVLSTLLSEELVLSIILSVEELSSGRFALFLHPPSEKISSRVARKHRNFFIIQSFPKNLFYNYSIFFGICKADNS